jgi:uridine kinase
MNLHHLKNLKYYKRVVLPVHSMKAHKGSRGTAPLILNLSTRC